MIDVTKLIVKAEHGNFFPFCKISTQAHGSVGSCPQFTSDISSVAVKSSLEEGEYFQCRPRSCMFAFASTTPLIPEAYGHSVRRFFVPRSQSRQISVHTPGLFAWITSNCPHSKVCSIR